MKKKPQKKTKKWTVRLPEELCQRIKTNAARVGQSVEQYARTVIERGMAA